LAASLESVEAGLLKETERDGKEHLAFLSREGQVLSRVSGTEAFVRIDKVPDEGELTLTHSHTVACSLSRSDILQLIERDNVSTVRAVDPHGTVYAMSKPPGWKTGISYGDYSDMYTFSLRKQDGRYWRAVLEGSSREEARAERTHRAAKEVAGKLGFEYSRVMR